MLRAHTNFELYYVLFAIILNFVLASLQIIELETISHDMVLPLWLPLFCIAFSLELVYLTLWNLLDFQASRKFLVSFQCASARGRSNFTFELNQLSLYSNVWFLAGTFQCV